MARFRGVVQGSRGAVSRLGSKNIGLETHADGWKLGISVKASVDENDNDVFHIYKTTGSAESGKPELILTVGGDEDGTEN